MLRLVVVTLLLVGSASAKDATREQRGRELYERGTAAFDAGRYDAAYAAFGEGYELSKKSAFLWNMAESSLWLGRRDRARSLYRQYLGEAPTGARRAEAEARLQALDKPSAAPTTPGSSLITSSPPSEKKASTPLYRRWWLWSSVAAVAAGVVTVAVLAQRGDSPSVPACSDCSLSPVAASW